MTPLVVTLGKDKSYRVRIEIEGRDVEAVFTVTLKPRTEKTGWSKPVKKHYLKPLEKIEEEALLAIQRFCERIASDKTL